MTGIDGYLAIGLAFFLVAVSPGPANLTNAVVAMERGRRVSFTFSLGLTFGIAVWGLVAAAGLGAALQESVYVLTVLKVLGGVYLLWLAWQSMRAAATPLTEPGPVAPAHGRWFLRGLMLNLSNPKTVVAWMAALSVGLEAGSTLWSIAVGFSICVTVALAVNLAYMTVFSLGGVMRTYRRIGRVVHGAMAGLYALAGAALLRSAVSR